MNQQKSEDTLRTTIESLPIKNLQQVSQTYHWIAKAESDAEAAEQRQNRVGGQLTEQRARLRELERMQELETDDVVAANRQNEIEGLRITIGNLRAESSRLQTAIGSARSSYHHSMSRLAGILLEELNGRVTGYQRATGGGLHEKIARLQQELAVAQAQLDRGLDTRGIGEILDGLHECGLYEYLRDRVGMARLFDRCEELLQTTGVA